MIRTLAEGMRSTWVDFETLHKKYDPVLALVKELIGVVPNCDPVLEIWPPGFRSYNLLVPNLFNLPALLFGKKSFKAAVGLAMYTASKTAACAYCTAHACSFALRRGAGPDAIKDSRTPKEQAIAALAEGLARIPADIGPHEVRAVREHFSDTEVEWLVLSVSMMGFLNKFMNVMGIALEPEAINDTATILAGTGWNPGKHITDDYQITNAKATTPKQDNLLTYVRVIRQAPGAVLLEKKWTHGVPGNYPAAAKYLSAHTGYSFPILKPIRQGRVVRVITAVLCDNLNKELTRVGLKIKMIAGYIFTRVVFNDKLAEEVKNMAAHIAPELDDAVYDKLDEIAFRELPADHAAYNETVNVLQQQLKLSEKEAATILLTRCAAPSPAAVNDPINEAVLNRVEPAGIVEIIVWISVLQLLHRLSSYYAIVEAY